MQSAILDLSPVAPGSVMGAVPLNIWRRQWSTWSSSLQMTPNRGDRSMCSQAGLLSRATQAGWRDGPAGTLWSSAKTNAKCCTWEGKKPLQEYRLGLNGGGAALRRRTWESWWTAGWTLVPPTFQMGKGEGRKVHLRQPHFRVDSAGSRMLD